MYLKIRSTQERVQRPFFHKCLSKIPREQNNWAQSLHFIEKVGVLQSKISHFWEILGENLSKLARNCSFYRQIHTKKFIEMNMLSFTKKNQMNVLISTKKPKRQSQSQPPPR